jgi:hypothetical protein
MDGKRNEFETKETEKNTDERRAGAPPARVTAPEIDGAEKQT